MYSAIQINKNDDLVELYTLLNENYVEDDDNMFRFDYSCEFLKWALTPPGWHTDWHCAVRKAFLEIKSKSIFGKTVLRGRAWYNVDA